MKKLTSNLIHIAIFAVYVTTAVFLLFSLINQGNFYSKESKKNQVMLTGEVSFDYGSKINLETIDWENESGKILVFEGHFNEDITDGKSLIFWPRNLRVKLYINGEPKISTGQRESFPSYIQYAGTSLQSWFLGTITSKDEIRIELERIYDSYSMTTYKFFFDNMFSATEGYLYRAIIKYRMLHPLLGLSLVVFGVILLIILIIQQMNQLKYVKRIYYLSFLCITGGICYICDSIYEFVDLLFPYPVFNTLIDLSCFPLLLISFFLFLTDILKKKESKKLGHVITAVFSGAALIAFFMQAAGLKDLCLHQQQLVMLGTILLGMLTTVLIFEAVTTKSKEQGWILISAISMLISLIFKVYGFFNGYAHNRAYLRIGILISSLILLFYTMRYMKHNIQLIEEQSIMKNELQKARTAIMLSQIQPHFLYNSLNVLQHICQKDGVLAAEAIEHFSHYLRGNMDSLTNDRLVPFTRELKHIRHYFYMEQLRFGERVKICYNLEVTDFMIPTLTLQPLVENAIRHGLTKKAEGGTVTIHTKCIKDDIEIIVSDNGIGFYIDNKLSPNRSHIGLNNVKKRLQLQCNGDLSITSTVGTGTCVTIRLKRTGSNENESISC